MGSCVLQIICELVACVILLSLHVSGNTNGSEPLCITSIKVPRNTQFRAPVMTKLQINCTVIIEKCQGNPKMSWCRIDGNDCKPLNQSNYIEMWKDGMLFLTFLNISMEDAGLYRCKSLNSISHAINVTVTAHKESADPCNQSNTNLNKKSNVSLQWLLPYVYISGGLVGLVVIVITLSIFIIKCRGRKSERKEITTKIQYVETQRSVSTTPSRPHRSTHPSSAGLTSAAAYGAPPIRAGSHRDHPSAGRLSANMTEPKVSRNNDRSTDEEENPLVYASLNHQAMSRGPRRTVQQETEPSEYAAIRFR